MSNQEKTPEKGSDDQAKPAEEKPVTKQKQPKRRGFFSSLISHLMVALIAVIAVSAYMHWTDILKYTGTRVCAYDMLGQYAGQPAKVPSVESKKPATDQSKELSKQQSDNKTIQQQTPAAQKPQADISPQAKDTQANETSTQQEFKQARDAARKLFWAQNDTAIAAYEKLIAKYPDNAGLRAELGNVYYKNEKTSQAIEAYLAAAKMFTRQKNLARRDEMIEILQKLAPEKAAKLIAGKQTTGQ